MITLITIALFLPLISSLVNIFIGKRILRKNAAWFSVGMMGLSFLCSLIVFVQWFFLDDPQPLVAIVNWLPAGDGQYLQLGLLLDGLGIAMVTMVSLISMLVHLYSVGYMMGDKRYERFFAYLSLFTFSMLGIVTANSLMQLFVFWELVGLTSYLLIGFWFEKRGPQLACKKAFVMNRVGDMGFLIGFGILFYKLGGQLLLPGVEGAVSAAGGEPVASMFSLLRDVLSAESAAAGLTGDAAYSILNPPAWLTLAGIGLFFGAMGKSAQFPLHTWLPDAMEGPTPVSSIVHSATMVAAGVYLTARIYPILTPGAHLFIATIGLVTCVMAACMALVMTDIKKVLAYSTLSQLGYMVLGLGAGAYAFALFHLFTHAFFKCCLFQCSGSVIHAAHHEQDMRYYGGLKDKMPITMVCYAICTLAIAGASLPYTHIGLSGYYSKDGIIAGAVNYGAAIGGWGSLFYWGPIAVAFITPFYMARSFALTFLGKPRKQELYDHAEEAPVTMWLPQVVLAFFAVFAALMPWLSFINETRDFIANADVLGATWIQPGDMAENDEGVHFMHVALLYGVGWILMIGVGIFMYKDGMRLSSRIVRIPPINILYTWALNKFYFDALIDVFAVALGKFAAVFAAGFDRYVIDGAVNMTGWLTRVSADATGYFDKRVVDGAVNGAAGFAQNSGNLLRTTQVGRIRMYVLLLFASAVIALTIVIVGAMAVMP